MNYSQMVPPLFGVMMILLCCSDHHAVEATIPSSSINSMIPAPDGYDRCTSVFKTTNGGGGEGQEEMVASLYNLVAAQPLVLQTPILNETIGRYYEFYINPCFKGDFLTKCGVGSRGYLAIVRIDNVTGSQQCTMFNDYALPEGVLNKDEGVTYFSQLSAFVANFLIANLTAQVVFNCNRQVPAASSLPTTANYDEEDRIITVETPLVCPSPLSQLEEKEVVLSTTSSDHCHTDFVQTGGIDFELDLEKMFGIGRGFTVENTVFILSPCAQVLFESCGTTPQSGYAGYTNSSTGVCHVFHERKATWDPLTLTFFTVFSKATTENGTALPEGTELKVATRCGRKHTNSAGIEENGILVFSSDDACPTVEEDEHHHHDHPEDEDEVPTGAVVGIVVGGVVAVIVTLIMCRWKMREGKVSGGNNQDGQYSQV